MNPVLAFFVAITCFVVGVPLVVWPILAARPFNWRAGSLVALGVGLLAVAWLVVDARLEQKDRAAQECVDSGGFPLSNRGGFERCLYSR